MLYIHEGTSFTELLLLLRRLQERELRLQKRAFNPKISIEDRKEIHRTLTETIQNINRICDLLSAAK